MGGSLVIYICFEGILGVSRRVRPRARTTGSGVSRGSAWVEYLKVDIPTERPLTFLCRRTSSSEVSAIQNNTRLEGGRLFQEGRYFRGKLFRLGSHSTLGARSKQ